MTPAPHRPEWQLPPGVPRGLWEYAHTDSIADEYDEYFACNSLFEFDDEVLAMYFSPGGPGATKTVADLGCGTGRALVPLAKRGFAGLAVDFSDRMLQIVRQKARAESLPIQCLRANLVELDCLADCCVDYAVCLFSTLGMIHGRQNRARMMRHMRRILKPGGVFVLHVHNLWYNLYDPGGPWKLLRDAVRSAIRSDFELGDKYFHYRGVPNMFLHVFRERELRRELCQAGFSVKRLIPLHPTRRRPLRHPWLLRHLRANGWIAVGE